MPFALVRRIAQTLFLVFGVSVLTFVFVDQAPGQYFEEMRLNPQISPNTLAALRTQYGLDRPLTDRYFFWVRSVARGEFGFSFAYNSPVWPLLKTRARNTLLLTLAAMLCSWLIAIPIGVVAAARAGGWEDRVSTLATTFFLATPDILLGLLCLAFALHTRWFPVGGMQAAASGGAGLFGRTKDLGLHLVLPVLALTAGTLPVLVRHIRSAMLEVLNSPFITAARGHGVARARLLFHHALPAAANPLVSLLGVSIGALLSGSLLVEVIMGWPGVGPMLLQAVLERDLYIVIAAVISSTLFLVTGNLIADMLLYVVDPRIRED
jgi:peptide/nickel transport system permease protein